MTTPTSIIASAPVNIPSPPPNTVQVKVPSILMLASTPLVMGVVITEQLAVPVVVGTIWGYVLVCTTVVSDGVLMSVTITRTVVVAVDMMVVDIVVVDTTI